MVARMRIQSAQDEPRLFFAKNAADKIKSQTRRAFQRLRGSAFWKQPPSGTWRVTSSARKASATISMP